MKRKVINTETTQYSRGSSIQDTLECGHVTFTKGSAGYANFRQCRDCDNLAMGCKVRIGNEFEKWNKKTKMPYRVPVADDPTYMDGAL